MTTTTIRATIASALLFIAPASAEQTKAPTPAAKAQKADQEMRTAVQNLLQAFQVELERFKQGMSQSQ